MSQQYVVKYCKPAPKTLKRWIDAHPERVREFDCGGGYCTGSDNDFAYDILLREGWAMSDDCVHTLIEPTVKAMLAQLRGVRPCDCDECKRELAENKK
ncbi:hypothetical protein [Paraburkholderia youngii]|uniref:hypothetical protein n=1 Tax=Paraburkholderia youngii TaxID=2782701 RepID=UPI0015919F8C|nr:hypothetical protein [Paraburkholderia youngii]NUX58701.1 hypothetical protein [Paraburkholderia youngii]